MIHLSGPTNFRSLEGIPNKEGKTIKPDVLFRSDELSLLTDADWKVLHEHHLAAICDLRRPDEREGYATIVPEAMSKDVTLHHWAYDDQAMAMMLGMADKIREAMAPLAEASDEKLDAWVQSKYDHYGSGFTHIAPHIRSVFDVVLNQQGKGAVLVHCAAGKDRTGFTIASLLAAVGVDREEILNDYVKTTESYHTRPPTREHLIPMLSRHGLDRLPQRVIDKLCIAYRPAMSAGLDYLEKTYGSVDGFLEKEIKVTPEERKRLREMLTH